MKTLASQYIEFQTGALLKSTELNDSFNYLIERDRLSRQYLAGLGIAYGLEVVLEVVPNTTKNETTITVTITKGAGVTSGGDLVALEEDCIYNTVGADGGLSKIDNSTITPEMLTGKCIVLKLEKSDGFIDNCFIRQDQKNKRFVQTIKPYLKNKTDISIPAQSLTVCLENPCLPVVKIEPLKTNDGDIYKSLFDTYKTANEAGIKSIKSAFFKIQASDCYKNLFCGQEFNLVDWEKYFEELNFKFPNNILIQQYVYDYLKTLIAAYDEFATTAWVVQKLETKLLNIQELALGNATNCDCRHGWYPSHNNGAAFKEAQFYANRMIALMTRTNLNFANIAGKDIKITLSNDNTPLSKKAIPYYFISQNVKDKWSYPLHQTNRVGAIPTYDAAQGCYTEGGTFYRIEGLMGKPIKPALTDLIQKRQASNTAFDIKVVTLSRETTDISAYFEDLQRQYHQIRLLVLCTFQATPMQSLQSEISAAVAARFELTLPLLLKNYCQKLVSNTDEDKKWQELIDRLRSYSPFCGWIYSLDELCFAYEQRLKDYLFYQFAQKHTGLVYCGGVPEGGTLVLVTMKTAVDNIQDGGKDDIKSKAAAIVLPVSSEYAVVAAFALPYHCCEEDAVIKCILDKKPAFETFDVVDDKANKTQVNIKITDKKDKDNTFTFEGKLANTQLYEWYIGKFLDKNTRLYYTKEVTNFTHVKANFTPQQTFKVSLRAASYCEEDAVEAEYFVKPKETKKPEVVDANLTGTAGTSEIKKTTGTTISTEKPIEVTPVEEIKTEPTKTVEETKPIEVTSTEEVKVELTKPVEDVKPIDIVKDENEVKLKPTGEQMPNKQVKSKPVDSIKQENLSEEQSQKAMTSTMEMLTSLSAPLRQRHEQYKKIIEEIEKDVVINNNKAFNLGKLIVFYPNAKTLSKDYSEFLKAISNVINLSNKSPERQRQYVLLLKTTTCLYWDKLVAEGVLGEMEKKNIQSVKDFYKRRAQDISVLNEAWAPTIFGADIQSELIKTILE